MTKKVKVLGLEFFNGEAQDVVDELKNGGLLVVPAAPALATIKKDTEYYRALTKSDIAIPDSGYMVLLTWLVTFRHLRKISGWRFMISFVADPHVQQSSIVLVDPRPVEAEANRTYLRSRGFKLEADDSYLAPMYKPGAITDPVLLELLERKKPKFIMINLGGGVQEKLGAYLKENLSYRPAIICTGAAIAFLTGHQATMPMWADKLFLGWLMRCIQKPQVYVPRYLRAFRLIFLVLRYGKHAPVAL
jgi:UDP-N-acetyl-D-mannosaminuronic acid transferase (WecB/TagA/CpsF family)